MVTGAGEFGDCFGSAHRAYTYGCGGHAWATYTAVPSLATDSASAGDERGTAAAVGVWWTAIGMMEDFMTDLHL